MRRFVQSSKKGLKAGFLQYFLILIKSHLAIIHMQRTSAHPAGVMKVRKCGTQDSNCGTNHAVAVKTTFYTYREKLEAAVHSCFWKIHVG